MNLVKKFISKAQMGAKKLELAQAKREKKKLLKAEARTELYKAKAAEARAKNRYRSALDAGKKDVRGLTNDFLFGSKSGMNDNPVNPFGGALGISNNKKK